MKLQRSTVVDWGAKWELRRFYLLHLCFNLLCFNTNFNIYTLYIEEYY